MKRIILVSFYVYFHIIIFYTNVLPLHLLCPTGCGGEDYTCFYLLLFFSVFLPNIGRRLFIMAVVLSFMFSFLCFGSLHFASLGASFHTDISFVCSLVHMLFLFLSDSLASIFFDIWFLAIYSSMFLICCLVVLLPLVYLINNVVVCFLIGFCYVV